MNAIDDLIALGKECAVDLTGLPEDSKTIDTPEKALDAIKDCLRRGKIADNVLKNVLGNAIYIEGE